MCVRIKTNTYTLFHVRVTLYSEKKGLIFCRSSISSEELLQSYRKRFLTIIYQNVLYPSDKIVFCYFL
ncbi:hypothetical protein FKM82_003340 [Ascaphus truei]